MEEETCEKAETKTKKDERKIEVNQSVTGNWKLELGWSAGQ